MAATGEGAGVAGAEHRGTVQPLLTDLYQITMAYAYWKSGKADDVAVFDLYFRKNPFHGEFAIFAGLAECLRFVEAFRYSDSDLAYLREVLPPSVEPAFFAYLASVTARDVSISAVEEGQAVFPRVPLLRVEGPLVVAQLLETTLLNLVNFATLMATNAARFRLAAGPDVELLEFGLRRAQGPDGGLSASKYAYMGGFDGTSNVLAGKLFGIPVKGTHAHSYVTSFVGLAEVRARTVAHLETGEPVDILALAVSYRSELAPLLGSPAAEASDGELAAFVSYATAFPAGFLALVDTYDVARSGLVNFSAVALALHAAGRRALGVRLDSGDLAYLSVMARAAFGQVARRYDLPWFEHMTIIASNDINEETILSLNDQDHKIDCFGIGTHLVTCQRQPALGCVYKLVEINGKPRIKLSQDVGKITMPGKKNAYRLFGADGHALIDLMQRSIEPPPVVGQKVLCRHPFEESKRAHVTPTRVDALHRAYWGGGAVLLPPPPLAEVRGRVGRSLAALRQDLKRNLNPTPYKVSVSDDLYGFVHDLWLENAPIGELA